MDVSLAQMGRRHGFVALGQLWRRGFSRADG